MALQLTATSMKNALEKYKSAEGRLRNLRERGEQVVERAVRTVEVSGAGFTLGVIQGAGVFKDGEVLKVPVELAAGLLFHGLNLIGMGGKHSDHLANFGDGAFASYLHTLGFRVGKQHWGGAGKGSMSGDLADRLSRIAAAA